MLVRDVQGFLAGTADAATSRPLATINLGHAAADGTAESTNVLCPIWSFYLRMRMPDITHNYEIIIERLLDSARHIKLPNT